MVSKSKAVIIPEWRSTMALRYGQRTIKMLRPVCAICQGEETPRPNWQKDCPHEPFVTITPVERQEPQFEPEVIDGVETGRQIVTGTKTVVTYRNTPNRVEVALSMKINSGRGVERAMFRKGYLHMKDLGSVVPSKLFPDGIAPCCEFRGCYQQKGLTEYKTGTFCRKEEAQLVAYTEDEGLNALEVGWGGSQSQERRDAQLAAVPL